MPRFSPTVFWLALVLVCAAPVAAQAAEPDILAPRLDLTIWTIVVFVILLAVLYRLAWKPMLQGLQARENNIQSAIEDSRKAQQEAQRLRDEILSERAKIEEARRSTIQKAESDAQRRAEEIIAAAEAKLKSEREQALREMASAKDQALQEIWRQTADLAAMVSSKAIRRTVTPEDHRRFVDEALAELRGAGNGQKTTASV